jgi:hypothetical protein
MNRISLRLRQSNPFYLLSAACMLGGCLAITNSFQRSNIPTPGDLKLLAVLNVYEAALIALAWYLIRRRGLVHDGAMLLCVEAFFLVDITFLNAQVVTSNSGLGLALTLLLLALAFAKLSVMALLLDLPRRDGRFAAIALQLVLLFSVPFVFRHFDHGDLPARFFYAAWWTTGLLIPACFTLSRWENRPLPPLWMTGIVRLLCTIPWVSLVIHIGISHYVYRVSFYGAELTPVFLGLACLLYHAWPARWSTRDRLVIQSLLAAAGVYLSLDNPTALCISIARSGRVYFTPTDIAIVGTYLALVYCYARRYAIAALAGGSVAGLAWLLGPTEQQLSVAASTSWSWSYAKAWSLVPKTAVSAGITAIAAAFAFLGLGALVSIRGHVQQLPPQIPGVDADISQLGD